jgi:hypothetical protein
MGASNCCTARRFCHSGLRRLPSSDAASR